MLTRILNLDFRRYWYEFWRDWKINLGLYDRDHIARERKIIGFGHHKCATKSIGQILEAICDLKQWSCFWGYAPITKANLEDLSSKYHVIFFHRTQASEFPEQFRESDFRGFHVIRDPRLILVSQYFSHRHTHELNRYTKDIEQDRNYLNHHSEEEGFLYLMNHSERFLETMSALDAWDFNDPRVLEIKFEELVLAPKEIWRKILTFTGIYLEEEELEGILDRFSFKNLRLRAMKVNNMSHYRAGRDGHYATYFTQSIKEAFKQRYGGLLMKPGYQVDMDW